jgi:hypothetical protein
VSVDPGGSARPLDEQQARLVDRLRAAHGAPVSFDELRSEGIENPATLCYELEVGGLRIARVHRPRASGRASPVGVRLDPDSGEQPPQPLPAPPRRELGRITTASAGLISRRLRAATARGFTSRSHARGAIKAQMRVGVAAHPVRPWMVALVLALGGAGATLALTHHGGGPQTTLATNPSRVPAPRAASPARHRAAPRTSTTPHRAAPKAPSPVGPSQPSAGSIPQAQTPSSPAAAAQLQAEGHQLLGQGRYAGAVSHLRAALATSDQSLNRCTEPATQACLTYAYALYDLGRALRLDGHPSAAVPVLSERLRIDNQRPTVQYELDLAREQLHTVPPTPPSGSPAHG